MLVTKKIVVLYKTSKLIKFKYIQTTYFSFIQSHISYSNIVSTITNKIKLLGKQKQAARITFN